MKRTAIIMVALGLTATATALLGAADIPRIDKTETARAEEVKGDLARAHSKYYEAVGYYQNAIKANGPSSNVLNKLGVAEMQISQRGSARKHFSQAVKIDPRNVAALNNLGVLACIERKYNPAVRYLKQALALQETNASAHLNMAEAWFGLGEIDRAMNEYTRALELDADILTSSPEAVVAHVSTPEQRARVDFTIAKAYIKRGNIEGALEYLRRAKEAHYVDLGKVYSDQAFAPLWDDPRLQKLIKR